VIAEQPFAELVLTVNISGDAAADRDLRMAGLDREAKAAPGEKLVQPAKCDTSFDLDPALGSLNTRMRLNRCIPMLVAPAPKLAAT
jgi:hypothetical protein